MRGKIFSLLVFFSLLFNLRQNTTQIAKNICSYLFHFTLLDTFFQDLNIFQLKCDWLNGLKAIQSTTFSIRFSKYRKFTSLIAVTFTSIKQSWFPFSGHESQRPVFLILCLYRTVTYLIKTKNNLSSKI